VKNNLIDKFLSTVRGNDLYIIRGYFSPLLTYIPWVYKNNKNLLPMLSIMENRKVTNYFNEVQYRKLTERAATEIYENKRTIDNFKRRHNNICQRIENEYSAALNKNWQLSSDDELINFINKYYVLFFEISRKLWHTVILDENIFKKIMLPGEYKKIINIWRQATHPHFESFDYRRKKDIIEVLDSDIDSDKAAKKLSYIYINYSDQKSEKEIKSLLSTIDLKKEKIEIAKYFHEKKKDREQYNKWLNILPNFERKIVKYIQFVQQEKDIRKDYAAKINALIFQIAEEIGKRAGLNQKYINLLTYEDFLNGINWISKNKKNIINREKRSIFFVDGSGNSYFEFFKAKQNPKEKLHKKIDKQITELKGSPAMKGKVIGRARIVLNVHRANLKEGEILIASMTRPEFLPLIKKAGAIITDEGGITSHAAILSRELKKPCIIGTKNATCVIKNGDMIEVDAKKGIIKIIKRAK
jgi:phosphohistidine swiveling domain-containing protein